LPLGTLPYRIFGSSTLNGAHAGIPKMAHEGTRILRFEYSQTAFANNRCW